MIINSHDHVDLTKAWDKRMKTFANQQANLDIDTACIYHQDFIEETVEEFGIDSWLPSLDE